jgi:hypothetical protein
MSRIHGRHGLVYIQINSTGEASPLPFAVRWSINYTVDKVEVTAMGDNNKTYVSGIPDAAGDMAGWYDTDTPQTYRAARDGIARKFYLYPDRRDLTKYHYGTVLPDFNASAAVDGAAEITISWNAASDIFRSDG